MKTLQKYVVNLHMQNGRGTANKLFIQRAVQIICKIKVLIFIFLFAFHKAEVQDASTDQLPQRDPVRNEAVKLMIHHVSSY